MNYIVITPRDFAGASALDNINMHKYLKRVYQVDKKLAIYKIENYSL